MGGRMWTDASKGQDGGTRTECVHTLKNTLTFLLTSPMYHCNLCVHEPFKAFFPTHEEHSINIDKDPIFLLNSIQKYPLFQIFEIAIYQAIFSR